VYFRKSDSPTWLQGTTENISHTGILFLSSSPLALESRLYLKVLLQCGAKSKNFSMVVCKGVVVRQERREAQEPPVALAVVIRAFRIVRQPVYGKVFSLLPV